MDASIKVTPVEGQERIVRDFPAYKDGVVRAGPCLLPAAYAAYAQRYRAFQFRSDDVVVLTYPKCGTTWTQEIVWTMLHNPDLDQDDSADIYVRSPFLEFDCLKEVVHREHGPQPDVVKGLLHLNPKADPTHGIYLQLAEAVPPRRVIKTHLPPSLLHPDMLSTCKVIYVVRNPKDLVVSFMHHNRILKVHDYQGNDEDFVDYFCSGDLCYGDYFRHVAEVLAFGKHENLLLLSFEEIKKDHRAAVKRIDEFIGSKLTDQQIDNVMKASSFENMKKRISQQPSTKEEEKQDDTKPGFFRKGKVGSWKTDLKPELRTKIDAWTEENFTKKLGYTFTNE